MAETKPTNNDLLFTVQTTTNSGSGGGTIYYINEGGVKRAWGRTNAYSMPGNTVTNLTITFPVGFFTTITGAHLCLTDLTNDARQSAYLSAFPTTTSAVLSVQGYTGSTAAIGGRFAWEVTGT